MGPIGVENIAFDGAGHLWATTGGPIREIDPSGHYRDLPGAGEGAGAGAGSIAVSTGGEVHVTDQLHVWRVDTVSGERTVVAGNDLRYSAGDLRPATSAQLSGGNGIAVDAAGNVYVADGANLIRRISPAGVITLFAGGSQEQGTAGDGGPAIGAGILDIGDITVGPDGVYFQDSLRIRRVDWAGVITTVAGNGRPGYTGDGGPAIEASFGPRLDHTDEWLTAPVGLAFDAAGNLFVADTKAFVIRRIDTNGIITTVAGNSGPMAPTAGLPARAAGLNRPLGVAVSPAGRLTISDSGHGEVLVVDEGGTMRLTVGGGRNPCPAHAPAGMVSLLNPTGVTYDPAGNLFVADSGHHCVLRVDRQGQATTIAGRGVPGFHGDGGPAVGAGLSYPGALAVDGAGNLLVTELYRVRKITGAAQVAIPTSARAWGWNAFGQLGDGTIADRRTPVPVVALGGSATMAAGMFHTLSVQPDGTVRAWGFNALGQLGDGTTVDRRSPTSVLGLTDVVAVAGGAFTSIALKADGTVWAWGHNAYGQVGDGTTTDRSVPTRVAGLTDVAAVSAGALHNLALRRDGTVWAWGWNGVGQLGDGTTVDRTRPVPVPGLAGVTLIGTGANHSFAVSSNGWTYAWGWNNTGQLGTNWGGDFHSPTIILQIGPSVNPSPIRQIVGGMYHSLALLADGTVYSWGWNGMGMLGDGTTQSHLRPAPVTGAAGATSISVGLLHSVAGYGDGSVRAWGGNSIGQLGDGTTVDRTAPVAVLGARSAGPVAAQAYSVVVAS
jgi:alpha-tubulin suppressor-like RCC1 family protein